MHGVQLHWFRHSVVRSSGFLDYLRREVHNPSLRDRLVEYVVHDNGRRVIALWVNRGAGTVVDLASYHPRHDPPSHEQVDQVLFNLNNTRRVLMLRDWMRRQMSTEYDYWQRWASEEAARRDLREHLRRKVPNLARREDPRWLEAI